jgi:hypothetical protein
MEVPNHQNKIRMFVQFDEPRPVLIINSKCVKPFIHAFQRFEVKRWMEGVGKKEAFCFSNCFSRPSF